MTRYVTEPKAFKELKGPFVPVFKEKETSMRKPVRVYVAGPYSQGSEAHNVRVALEAAETLLRRGYAPYVPHLTHFWHLIFPHGYETWMGLDFDWLDVCDAVLRLPGESPGADRETARAHARHIPVNLSLDDFPPLE